MQVKVQQQWQALRRPFHLLRRRLGQKIPLLVVLLVPFANSCVEWTNWGRTSTRHIVGRASARCVPFVRPCLEEIQTIVRRISLGILQRDILLALQCLPLAWEEEED